MTDAERQRIVFDCNLFAQALISTRGPAATCFTYIQRGAVELVLSDYVLQEIRELPSKIKPKYGVDDAKVELLIRDLEKYATFIKNVPSVYVHPLDPDDSHYVDLAAATWATVIASRDKHLSALMDEKQVAGREFKERFPAIEILAPEVLLNRLRMREQQKAAEPEQQRHEAQHTEQLQQGVRLANLAAELSKEQQEKALIRQPPPSQKLKDREKGSETD